MSKKTKILVVEDEADLADLLCFNLKREGYDCTHAGNGRAALAAVDQGAPDLIILDRMLPELSGDDVASSVRRNPRTTGIPIIMLTAKAEETDELVGFALGADDYITKPFSIKSVLARVAVVLRRASSVASPSDATANTISKAIESGPFSIDSDRHQLTVDKSAISVTATEFRLFRALVMAEGRVLDRSQLIDAALGEHVAVTDRTIDVHVTSLRKKIAAASAGAESWIQTVRGVGYTFRPPG